MRPQCAARPPSRSATGTHLAFGAEQRAKRAKQRQEPTREHRDRAPYGARILHRPVNPIRPDVPSNTALPSDAQTRPRTRNGPRITMPSPAEPQDATDDSSHVSRLIRGRPKTSGYLAQPPGRGLPRIPSIETDCKVRVKWNARNPGRHNEETSPDTNDSLELPKSPFYHDQDAPTRQYFSHPKAWRALGIRPIVLGQKRVGTPL
jgi:hypothetical protein